MRYLARILFLVLAISAFAAVNSANATVVYLDKVNNGNDLVPADQISVEYTATADGWHVFVTGGLAIEEFYFNYDQALSGVLPDIQNVTPSESDDPGWAVNYGGGQADGYGSFDVKFNLVGSHANDGTVFSLEFDIMVAGLFDENAATKFGHTGFTFAAKIASEAEGAARNAGGFVSTIGPVSTVPLPGAVWLFLSALGGLFGVGYARRRRTA